MSNNGDSPTDRGWASSWLGRGEGGAVGWALAVALVGPQIVVEPITVCG